MCPNPAVSSSSSGPERSAIPELYFVQVSKTALTAGHAVATLPGVRTSSGATILIALIVCLGAVLRFLSVTYGLPSIYHPDETHLIFNFGKFLEGIVRGSLTMDTSTFYYPLAVLYGAYFLLGRWTGRFASLDDFKDAVALDDPALHLLGRLLSASLSVGALFLTYLLGRRLYGGKTGTIAAGLMAVSLLDISSSHWLKLDSAVTFMALLSLLAMLQLKKADGLRSSVMAGLCVGAAMATRLDAFVLLPLLIAAHLFLPHNQATAVQEGRRRPGCSQRVVVAMGVALLSYLVISFRGAEILFRDLLGHAPIFLTREVAASVIEYFQVGEIAHSLAHNLQFYLLVAMVGTFGVALTVFVFIGFLKAVLHWRREEALILGFVFLSLVPLLTFTAYGTHYLVTLVPICMILAAEAIRSVASWLEHRLFPSGSEVAALTVTAGILCLVFVQPLLYSVQYVAYLVQNQDTRERAREWISRNITAGERIAVQKFYELPRSLPALHESREQLLTKLSIVRADGRSSGLAFEALLAHDRRDGYEIVNLSIEPHWSSPDSYLENSYDYAELVAHGVKYIILSGRNNPLPLNEDGSPIGVLIPERFYDAEALRRSRSFMQLLNDRELLVAEFQSRDPRIALQTDSPIDPTIRIYRVEP